MFTMRFDLRARDGFATAPALYEAALEMAAWGEANGALAAVVSEHHASEDGYLPAPLILATAMAARTRTLPIQVAALLVPLHDPIALAEQMAVLDIVSSGRVSYVCAIGYRAEEYAMFGQDMKGRGRRLEACLAALKQAWTGEPFEYEGRPVRVTPTPKSPGGPMLLMGGNSRVAVRRAAKFGMGMMTQGGDASLQALYEESCRELGTTPGMFINPLGELGGAGSVSKSVAGSVAELRAENGSYRIFTPEEAITRIRNDGMLLLQPLSGGLPPELAWPCLELLKERVLPAVRPAGA
jgi:hypothetical protein